VIIQHKKGLDRFSIVGNRRPKLTISVFRETIYGTHDAVQICNEASIHYGMRNKIIIIT